MRRQTIALTSSVLLMATFLACQSGVRTANGCLNFARQFQSVSVDAALVDDEFLLSPLPDTLRRLEAGFDPSCRIGGTADIEIQCPDGDDPRPQTIIKDAPVIWTDRQGFTVVVVSLQDHERLEGLDLFWARCDGER